MIGERGVIYNPFADRWQLSSDMDVNYMLVAERPSKKEAHDPRTGRIQLAEGLEPPAGGRRRPHVIPKWRANKELLRKHFLLSLDGKTGAGVYIWPSVAAASGRITRLAAIGDQAHRGAPTIRYFDLFLLIDNEKAVRIPEAAEFRPGGIDAC